MLCCYPDIQFADNRRKLERKITRGRMEMRQKKGGRKINKYKILTKYEINKARGEDKK